MLALTNGHIITMEDEDLPGGSILLEDGLIAGVGQELQLPAAARQIDLAGKYVTPGLIDAHCHLGISQDLQSLEAERDCIEDYVLPQLRMIDAIDVNEEGFATALANGVTSVAVSPGSAYVLSGQVAVIKTAGHIVDEMILREPAALKLTIGESFSYRGLQHKVTPQSRMMVVSRLRETFVQASNYAHEEQGLDLGKDIVLQAKRGRLPVFVHARRSEDIMTALRLAREFSLSVVIVHGLESEEVAHHLCKNEVPLILSHINFTGREEQAALPDWGLPARLYNNGVQVAFCSDHPASGLEKLRQCAVLAYQHGLPRREALAALTCNVAGILGIETEVGSLTPEKHADLVVWDRDPLLPEAVAESVYINGRLCYQRS